MLSTSHRGASAHRRDASAMPSPYGRRLTLTIALPHERRIAEVLRVYDSEPVATPSQSAPVPVTRLATECSSRLDRSAWGAAEREGGLVVTAFAGRP